jgi:pantoate--beta-alanine ligase
MQIVNTIDALNRVSPPPGSPKVSTGFVPTMGALHQGHLSLIARSVKECDRTFSSVFVNPIQFNNASDLEKYPVRHKQDFELLSQAGCDLVFSPEPGEMYPEKKSREEMFREDLPGFDFDGLDTVMEGKYRPGHFEGVLVVVNRLFKLLRPSKSYFGKKDYQQLRVITKLAEQFFPEMEIVACPTIREAHGLAMSSRNARLSPEGRIHAGKIFEILSEGKDHSRDVKTGELKKFLLRRFEMAGGFNLEYLEVASLENLQPVAENLPPENAGIFVALEFEGVRLIDNLELVG